MASGMCCWPTAELQDSACSSEVLDMIRECVCGPQMMSPGSCDWRRPRRYAVDFRVRIAS